MTGRLGVWVVLSLVGREVRGSLTGGLGGRGITLIGGLEVGWLSYWWTRGGMQEDLFLLPNGEASMET